MEHRHLNHQRFSLAAIDDVISRGRRQDWAALRQGMLDDTALMEKIRQVCQAKIVDPYAQRYHFWMNYVDSRSRAA